MTDQTPVLPDLPPTVLRFAIQLTPLGESLDYTANQMRDYALAAIAAQATDAGRYRWLRSQHEGNSASCCVFSPDDKYECLVPVGSLPGELDALVDAAINAKKGKK